MVWSKKSTYSWNVGLRGTCIGFDTYRTEKELVLKQSQTKFELSMGIYSMRSMKISNFIRARKDNNFSSSHCVAADILLIFAYLSTNLFLQLSAESHL